MRCLQVNAGRSKAAHDLVYSTAKKIEIDLVIISEPNINISKNKGYIMDLNNDVAVYITNKNMGITGHEIGEGFVKIEFAQYVVYGCYCSPNITNGQFQVYADRVMNDAKHSKEAVIAGDLT